MREDEVSTPIFPASSEAFLESRRRGTLLYLIIEEHFETPIYLSRISRRMLTISAASRTTSIPFTSRGEPFGVMGRSSKIEPSFWLQKMFILVTPGLAIYRLSIYNKLNDQEFS